MVNLKVKVVDSNSAVILLRNVTEIHYFQDPNFGPMVAFESDIQSNGFCTKLSLIREFEVLGVEAETAEYFTEAA